MKNIKNLWKVLKNGIKVLELEYKNKKLLEINQDLRQEHEEYLQLKNNYIQSSKNTILMLLDLQDINRLGISEAEKNKRRNQIINNLKKLYSNKIIELEYPGKAPSSTIN